MYKAIAFFILYIIPAAILTPVLNYLFADTFWIDLNPFVRGAITGAFILISFHIYIYLCGHGIIFKEDYALTNQFIRLLETSPFKFVTDERGLLYINKTNYVCGMGECTPVKEEFHLIQTTKLGMANNSRLHVKLKDWEKKHPHLAKRNIDPITIKL